MPNPKTRVLLLSANLGNYDPPSTWVPQAVGPDIALTTLRLTDTNFPPRPKAMTSRLQCGIPKMFAWQLWPDYHYYIWVDASRSIASPDLVMWWLDRCALWDIAIFHHPERGNIVEEYQFIKRKLEQEDRYLTSRYEGEWLDQQAGAILGDQYFVDNRLYASTFFAYKPNERVKEMMRDWFYHKARYLLHDQLALPYVLWKWECRVNVINESIYKFPMLPMAQAHRGRHVKP